MQKNQTDKNSPNAENKKERELADKVTDGKNMNKKDKADKRDRQDGAVLADINGDAGKKAK